VTRSHVRKVNSVLPEKGALNAIYLNTTYLLIKYSDIFSRDFMVEACTNGGS